MERIELWRESSYRSNFNPKQEGNEHGEYKAETGRTEKYQEGSLCRQAEKDDCTFAEEDPDRSGEAGSKSAEAAAFVKLFHAENYCSDCSISSRTESWRNWSVAKLTRSRATATKRACKPQSANVQAPNAAPTR